MKYDLLLKDCSIIDENGCISEGKNIFVTQGVISKISKVAEGGNTDFDSAREVVDCGGYYVTPGLVNLHAHSSMNVFKGIAEDVNINDWFNREIFPYESKMEGDDVYFGSLLAIAEMLNNGVTAFADHYFYSERICDAVIASGIKGDIAPTIFGLDDSFVAQLEMTSKMIQDINSKSSRLHVRMGPHSPYLCPPAVMKTIIDEAKALGVGIHLHMSETEKQVEDSMKIYGKTPFEVLYEAGGFEVPVIVAHGLWIMEEDKKFLNSSTYFAGCPKTYMKLAMGSGNLWKFYKDIQLCIGTDGAASSNTLNPLEQVRLFSMMGKFLGNNSEDYVLEDMWKILMRGHKALNFNSGFIKEGYSADLAIWNLKDIKTAPVYNPLASIIYSADSNNIIHTIVNGEFVKKDGKLCMDVNIILENVNNSSKEILLRGKQKSQIIF